jgi:ABC-2 type transport system permease protein
MGAVFLREVQSYFQGITGYIFLGLFLLFAGLVFAVANLWPPGSSDFRSTLSILTFIFIVAVPVLTMRLLSEETRQKTDQLLLTSPAPLSGIVLGKYFAALALFSAALAVTGVFPALLDMVGLVVPSELFTAYLGVFLMGAAMISIGTFVSSLTDNQVSAALFTFGAILFTWIINWLQQALPSDRISGVVFAALLAAAAGAFVFSATRAWWVAAAVGAAGLGATGLVYLLAAPAFDGLIVRVLRWFSLLGRYQVFASGVLAVGPVLYYLCFTATFLFFTVRVIEKRRWA